MEMSKHQSLPSGNGSQSESNPGSRKMTERVKGTFESNVPSSQGLSSLPQKKSVLSVQKEQPSGQQSSSCTGQNSRALNLLVQQEKSQDKCSSAGTEQTNQGLNTSEELANSSTPKKRPALPWHKRNSDTGEGSAQVEFSFKVSTFAIYFCAFYEFWTKELKFSLFHLSVDACLYLQ